MHAIEKLLSGQCVTLTFAESIIIFAQWKQAAKC